MRFNSLFIRDVLDIVVNPVLLAQCLNHRVLQRLLLAQGFLFSTLDNPKFNIVLDHSYLYLLDAPLLILVRKHLDHVSIIVFHHNECTIFF